LAVVWGIRQSGSAAKDLGVPGFEPGCPSTSLT
jgi:hypothetical protein